MLTRRQKQDAKRDSAIATEARLHHYDAVRAVSARACGLDYLKVDVRGQGQTWEMTLNAYVAPGSLPFYCKPMDGQTRANGRPLPNEAYRD